ncbi:hypothetical protein [Methanoregula formicica]|uniref:Uncharacterized protein n=1 Tax=Methanoregula formicica (strain DSM 22288 / NBRC 105244 / SMSP) TaxID=593750 RepID=L0HEF7_METFS|nr:hypothetical protein [Methanoregula formicica]AGB02405.1 hypothetical protein Metfor_1366 [Methanoregula formicica SMSP]
MVKEKMATLKIRVPARWAEFIEEYYRITGLNRDDEMRGNIASSMEGFMLESGEISMLERSRLIEKYHLLDVYPATLYTGRKQWAAAASTTS